LLIFCRYRGQGRDNYCHEGGELTVPQLLEKSTINWARKIVSVFKKLPLQIATFIIIIIGKDTISYMQGIYTYIPETNHVPKEYIIIIIIIITEYIYIYTHTGKAIPLQAWTGPEGSSSLRPRFQNNQHMKVVRLSALCTGRRYSPGNIPGIHFC
jgi:hypothetical protein